MNRLAKKIKDARQKSGLSEKELAKRCGLSASYIIQIESGKKIINEKAADNILKVLGTKAEMLEETSQREEMATKKEKPKAKKAQPITYSVEPNAQWASALAGVIKKYNVVDCLSNKTVSYKELPIISKKVEGHNPDRIMFIKVSDDELEVLRINKGDVVTVLMTKEVQNDNLYLVIIDGKRYIRKVRKENNCYTFSKGVKSNQPVRVEKQRVEILGKCLKVEFDL